MYRDIVFNLPVDPPWVDFIHYTECENQKLFKCKDTYCPELIPDTELNWCPNCLIFIPRITECVCDEINQTM